MPQLLTDGAPRRKVSRSRLQQLQEDGARQSPLSVLDMWSAGCPMFVLAQASLQCYSCKGYGHIAKKCALKGKKTPAAKEVDTPPPKRRLTVRTANCSRRSRMPSPRPRRAA